MKLSSLVLIVVSDWFGHMGFVRIGNILICVTMVVAVFVILILLNAFDHFNLGLEETTIRLLGEEMIQSITKGLAFNIEFTSKFLYFGTAFLEFLG